jgi:hypothetical protein
MTGQPTDGWTETPNFRVGLVGETP